MVEMPPQCPDCDVKMEQMNPIAGGHNLRFVSEESKEGILGSIGVNENFDVNAFVCSECGLSRLYANLDD